MFSHKTTIRMTLVQYLIVLVLHILYGVYYYGAAAGKKMLACAVLCYGSAFLVKVFSKNETIVINYILLSMLTAIWYMGRQMSGVLDFFVPMIATALLVSVYLSFWRNVAYLAISDFVLIANALYSYRLPKDMRAVMSFLLLFVTYNLANFTMCWLVYFIEKRMDVLEEKTKEALSASESKGAFLANMSHEIRTPLNAIHGLNQLILQERITDDVRDKALGIQTASSDLLTIINDILDFSKIESGKLEIIESEYDTKDMISDVVNLVYLRTEEHHVEFLVDCDCSLPKRLYGDEVRIKQVIMNLLTNATKFTNEGYVKLKITFEYQGDEVILKADVEDTGIGIPQSALNRLFDSFEQVDTKKNRKVEGTGLGLAISKQLVVLMNGNISVSSEYGIGSVFSIAIPQKVVSKEPIVEIANKEVKVLVYMPNDIFRQVYERMFSMVQISCVFTTQFAVVQDYAKRNEITHFVINDSCYEEQRDSFVELSKRAQVVVAQSRSSNISVKDGIKTVYRPFYLIPLEAILNGESSYGIFSKEDVWDFDYVAPKAKILVVDDNDVNLRVSVGLMKPLQMQITTANSGAKAIDLLKEERFDMIFMDHMMPEMDGVEATRLIRELSKEKWDYYDTLPIVALTANAIGGAKEMFLANGFQDFLAKPLELRDLDRVIRKWLPVGCLENKTSASMVKEDVLEVQQVEEEIQQEETAWPKEIEGLDIEVAKHYFADDAQLFLEVLSSFYTAALEKMKVLKEAYIKKDWSCYAIEAHALKSSSKSIGAMDFSAQALELEMASKAEDADSIKEKHRPFMQALDQLTKQISPYVEVEENEDLLPLMRMKELKQRMQRMCILSATMQEGASSEAKAALEELTKLVEDCLHYRYSRDALKEQMRTIAEMLKAGQYAEARVEVDNMAEVLNN